MSAGRSVGEQTSRRRQTCNNSTVWWLAVTVSESRHNCSVSAVLHCGRKAPRTDSHILYNVVVRASRSTVKTRRLQYFLQFVPVIIRPAPVALCVVTMSRVRDSLCVEISLRPSPHSTFTTVLLSAPAQIRHLLITHTACNLIALPSLFCCFCIVLFVLYDEQLNYNWRC